MGLSPSSSTREVVTAYLEALNGHDADRIAGCVTDDFVNEHTAAGAVSRHGRAAYRAALDDFLTDFADLTYTVEHLIADGDRAAVTYRMSFRMVSAGDRPVTVRGVFVFAVRDGLVAHRTDYWDSGEVRRQLS